MSFKFQGKYVLLTYAQCGNLAADAVGNMLNTLNADYIIGEEQHQDGGRHLHAFGQWKKAVCYKRADKFDVNGYHPNIKTITYGKPAFMYDYAIKDRKIVGGSCERPIDKAEETRKRKREDKQKRDEELTKKIRESKSRAEAEQHFEEMLGRQYYLGYNGLKSYLDDRFTVEAPKYETPIGTTTNTEDYPELGEWVKQYVEGWKEGSEFYF